MLIIQEEETTVYSFLGGSQYCTSPDEKRKRQRKTKDTGPFLYLAAPPLYLALPKSHGTYLECNESA